MPTKSFYENFKQNMANLGLDAPQSLFSTQEKAVATITAIARAVSTLGTSVTVTEVALAGTNLEILIAVGAVSASFYLGACIGSLIMATQSYISDRISFADFHMFTIQHRVTLAMPELHHSYHQYSFRNSLSQRSQYA